MSQAERNVYALTALHKYYVRILISALAKQYMISCKSKAAVFPHHLHDIRDHEKSKYKTYQKIPLGS